MNTFHHPEQQYLELLAQCRHHGAITARDRTGTGTSGVFGRMMRFDLSDGFPILTTKRVPFRIVVAELLWMLRGETNIRSLLEQDVHIWTEWPYARYVATTGNDKLTMTAFEELVVRDPDFAAAWGDLGPVYGKQWRHWQSAKGPYQIDQLAILVDNLQNNPKSRRHILEAWNVDDLDDMALPPCHKTWQFYVSDGRLSCQLYQRSADIFLGVPFNLAAGALMTHVVAREAGLEVGEFIHTFGDLHLYLNHIDQADQQLKRSPRLMPNLTMYEGQLFGVGSKVDYTVDDFELVGYEPHPAIKAPVSV